MLYQIKREGTLIFNVRPNGSQQREVMGKDIVQFDFSLPSFVEFKIGDSVEVYGKTYVLNKRAFVEKVSSILYDYKCTFEALGYDLIKVKYLFYDGSNNLTVPEFSLTGNAETFIDLIIVNANRVSSGWVKGDIDETEFRSISFDGDNCRAALAKVADEFKVEFWVDGQTINLTKRGQLTTLKFEYGKGKGLYSIKKSVSDDKDVFSRLYAFGSTKNIPLSYGHDRLQLPGNVPFITNPVNLAEYGVIEALEVFDGSTGSEEIYPHRKGSVTGVSNAFTFQDGGMDFNINDFLLDGVEAKVAFHTGDLAGYEFIIKSYNNSNKTFTINQNKEEKDFKIPDENGLKASIGDQFTIIDIEMPASYITEAETKLLAAATEYYLLNSNGRELYEIDCDPLYFKDKNLDNLQLGDFVEIKDTPMGIDKSIRMISINRDLQTEFKYTIMLADTASIATIVREYFEQQNTRIVIKRNNLNNVNKARRNWRNTEDLRDLVFDPEGNYYTEKIKPASIETLYLSVGAKAQNFSLNGVVIQPNFMADENVIYISSGQLVHYTLEVAGIGSIWEMESKTFGGLDPLKSYYLFAKISKTALTGTWEMSEEPLLVDDITGYWTLGTGVLFKVEDGFRNFEFNKGMTYIVGDAIKTGRIQSMDAQNFFDLTQGTFNLGDSNSGIDWDITKNGTLTIRGGISVNQGGIGELIGVFRGEYSPTSTYYEGDTVTYDGSTWRVVSAYPITGIDPSELAEQWLLTVKKGQTGAGTNIRVIYRKGDDPDNAPSLDVNAHDPSGWSLQMPEIDTYWILSTQEGDYISGMEGDQYLTSVDGQYIWASTEVLDVNGAFSHWSAPTRISGRNGIPTEYTEYRFQKNGSPLMAPTVAKTEAMPPGWTIELPMLTAGEYLWLIKANKLPNGTLVSAWSDPIRTNGVDGGAVGQGDPGPFMQFRGLWKPTVVYAGNSQHIDAVEYLGSHYVARVDAGNIPAGTVPTDLTYWNSFAGEFESIATGLLLAELAFIKNLGVYHLRTSDAGKRIELKGYDAETPTIKDNTLIFYDENNEEVLVIDDDLDSNATGEPLAGIRVFDPYKDRTAYITGNGFFSNAGGTSFLPGTTGMTTNASVVGLLFDKNPDNYGISAAVAGIDATGSTSGNSESWGGYFNSLKVTGKVDIGAIKMGGLSVGTKSPTGDYTIGSDESFITTYHNTGLSKIYLPAGDNLKEGRIIYVRRVNAGLVSIYGNGNQIMGSSGSVMTVSTNIKQRWIIMLIWDGSFWHIVGIA